MTKEKVEKKLKALKALAERGVGGEKETAGRLYGELKKKYGVEENTAGEEKQQFSSGVSIYMDIMGFALQQELENCDECPYRSGEEICGQCGTYENIKDICLRIEKAKRERGRAG